MAISPSAGTMHWTAHLPAGLSYLEDDVASPISSVV
jgi:hypothetical protein